MVQLSPAVKFVIAGVALALGLFFLILAAALDKTYYSFLILIPALIVFIPIVIVPPNPDGEGSFFQSLCNFIVGVALISVPGLMLILKHVGAITGKDLFFCTASIVCLIVSVVFVALAVRRDEGYSTY